MSEISAKRQLGCDEKPGENKKKKSKRFFIRNRQYYCFTVMSLES